jgi:hypothetical protein
LTNLADTKIAVPCPECGQTTDEPIERIATNDIIPCSLCQGFIDLSTEECREKVDLARDLPTSSSHGQTQEGR